MSSENHDESVPQSFESEEKIEVPAKILTPAAQRALAEAEQRRAQAEVERLKAIEEGGPSGPEPTRYGDWERKGIAVDF
ncbi:DUF1674 domain-containing protein [Asticcacaulis sp. YBE204]|uniref:DUF1674 domain-containing protein n=1 Tax=Asticcacaulis sp. YBE204 TaxID=1282363 RepID=UPI0003C407E4|nr:DUF1674 domain-containing protein [Asticcacaulis sp. YBE204]ESQ80822.1 hypothetical protein AEYBE204_00445 [Asticcacaulis sp. YBE204]